MKLATVNGAKIFFIVCIVYTQPGACVTLYRAILSLTGVAYRVELVLVYVLVISLTVVDYFLKG